MKKLLILLSIIFIAINFSSCQVSRRGIQFYSGDKNTNVIEDQLTLTQSKKTEYETRLSRLQRERESILSSSQSESNKEIIRLENENRRFKAELGQLKGRPQRVDASTLLSQVEEIKEKIDQNDSRLAYLYQSEKYPSQAKNLDNRIESIDDLLFNLQIAEDQMLVKMTQKENLDFFQGNIRNGYEGANAYMLMKWAQEPTTGTAVNTQEKGQLQGIIVNEFHRGVTAVIRHSSGLQLPDIPLEPKSSVVIDLPFPGEYICYFKRGSRTTNTVVKSVNPRLLVNYKGDNYAFVLTQRGY